MGLLDSFSGKKQLNISDGTEPSVTPEDKKWVESCFRWLARNFGEPVSTIYLFNAEYFLKTFSKNEITTDNLLDDLCNLLKIEKSQVHYEIVPGLSGSSGTPNETQGKAFESDLELNTINPEKPKYTIHLAENPPNEYILLRRLVIELVRLKMNEIKKDSIYNPNDIYIAYLAAVHFGFGVLISKLSSERIQYHYIAGGTRWQRTYTARTEVRYPLIAFALAGYCNLTHSDYEKWESELPLYVKKEFELSLKLLEESPLDLTSKEKPLEELSEFEKHRKASREFYDNKNYVAAISEYKQAVVLTDDLEQQALLYNNIGYSYLMLKEYQESIVFFENALKVKPNYPFAKNNLGFIYLMLEQPDKAKEYLDSVEITSNIIKAYHSRDMAIYYMKKNDMKKAGDYFMKTFEVNVPVDLLEFFYATYLFATSEDEEAIQYLTISVNKGEKEGIELMKIKEQS